VTTLRWHRASLEDASALVKLRWHRASLEGTSSATPTLRWHRASLEGTAAVIVAPIGNKAGIEPESTVVVTAVLLSTGPADTWTWRLVSGPSPSLSAVGSTATMTAPSNLNGTSFTIGVTATLAGVTSPEVTFTVGVLPQTEWWSDGVGGWTPNVTTYS
jgi:hypothetical protein